MPESLVERLEKLHGRAQCLCEEAVSLSDVAGRVLRSVGDVREERAGYPPVLLRAAANLSNGLLDIGRAREWLAAAADQIELTLRQAREQAEK